MIGFTLPIRDNQSAEDILDAITGFSTRTVADKFVHSSPFTDVIFKSVNELFIRFNTIDVRDQRRTSNEKLSSLNATINSRSIAEDGVSSNRFITTPNITCRKTGFPMLSQSVGDSPPSVLCSHAKGFLDSISRSPSEERA